MKPDQSIMPQRARVVVPPRPKFTAKRRLSIFMAHGGRCGICGLKIHGDDYDIEHRIARAISANDADDNLYPAHRGCHATKTTQDRKDIAKAQRLAKETCTREPARKLKSRGFGSIVRGLDGKIKLTKRAARLAADNDAGGTEK
ncbi:HNH endonuclease [Brevundimonas aurantiaca]|uniref:HNH endonuclease n=1 Tax=Brevundimonas aurantiaca TaxID=74316 RepID=UPI001D1862F9|nr:HNH endonuclease signature motif containing protein [Brevundimonas aurantiaca]MCC4295817.1 HNH endonuclease [Brevundimonas aurantiaca]